MSAEQAKAIELLDELTRLSNSHVYEFRQIEKLSITKDILNSDLSIQRHMVRETINRIGALGERFEDEETRRHVLMNLHHEKNFPKAGALIAARLLRRNLSFSGDDLAFIAGRLADVGILTVWNISFLPTLVKLIETHIKKHGITEDIRTGLQRMAEALSHSWNAPENRLRMEVEALTKGIEPLVLAPGEAWSDAALAFLNKEKSEAWNALLAHCQQGGKTKYTLSWRKAAETLLKAVRFEPFRERISEWLLLVDKPRTQPWEHQNRYMPDQANLILDAHIELLRGLAWCSGFREDADLARALMRLAISAYRKIPGRGPRHVSLGNAAVTGLSLMPGKTPIGQLAILKVKVKFGTAQKEIEKAFNATAVREDLPRDEIEELAVPAYGLSEVGKLDETFGEYLASVRVDGTSAEIGWSKAGKPLKSLPATVKTDHGEDVKELQTAVKDLNTMLPAQRERIDSLFLARKTWPLALWKERYLDHPLVGTIARRLIWTFTSGPTSFDGAWYDGALLGLDGKPLTLPADVSVTLWHPIGHAAHEIAAWREWIESRQIQQPFKQAHREVYLLTDAERRTNTYSNRFAAHILRQHQFNALAQARGWKNKLRLMVDDTYPPTSRNLPTWNLRAEYWVEGIGDQFGVSTNESGVYLHLVTDQVRFYSIEAGQAEAHAGGGGYDTSRTSAEPILLEQIPPLVLSEILRDVDLFVGVASVGNDPTWADGGPEGRHRDYWNSYSFGELSASAQTRKAILTQLLPRLKIAKQCTLEERFLVVNGSLRTYKIHLGSGNILMAPNDQYLCIVPKQTTASREDVFLPFEGDNVLSIILSKSLLLASDDKIKDPTITSQIMMKR